MTTKVKRLELARRAEASALLLSALRGTPTTPLEVLNLEVHDQKIPEECDPALQEAISKLNLSAIAEVKEEKEGKKKMIYKNGKNIINPVIQARIDRFKGAGEKYRKFNSVEADDLKEGDILERELKYKKEQYEEFKSQGKGNRYKALHVKVGKGFLNTTLMCGGTLSVAKGRGAGSLITKRPIDKDLLEAFQLWLEKGKIDHDLDSFNSSILYDFINKTEWYGKGLMIGEEKTPIGAEKFYTDTLMVMLERGQLAPLSKNDKSLWEELFAIVKFKKIFTPATLKLLKNKADRIFRRKGADSESEESEEDSDY